jgi:hypothetical protein
MSEPKSPKVRTNVLVAVVVVILVLLFSVAYYAKVDLVMKSTSTTTSSTSKTSIQSTSTTTASSYPILTFSTITQSINQSNSVNETSLTASDTTFTTHFSYWIIINYSGSWNLVYWGQDGIVTQYNATNYNVKGDLNGTGDYESQIITYGVGYVENTLCARATKLDSSQNNLTLEVLYGPKSTTAPFGTVTACGYYGV